MAIKIPDCLHLARERAIYEWGHQAGLDAKEEIKKILKKACDREWEDEDLHTTAVIVANTITWRDLEIESLKAELGRLPGLIDEPKPFLGQLSKINEEEKKTYWPYGW